MTSPGLIKTTLHGNLPDQELSEKQNTNAPTSDDNSFFQSSANLTNDTNLPEYFRDDFEITTTTLKPTT